MGLYAGANEDGVLSNLNVDLKAGVYNYTAIPVSSPTVNYNSVADRGAVDVSGTVRSTKDINAIASGGKENVVTDESKWAAENEHCQRNGLPHCRHCRSHQCNYYRQRGGWADRCDS